MKKLFKVSMFIFALSIVFTSCKKDNEIQEKISNDPTEQKILSFIEKMNNGNKSGDFMCVEDAVWYIEAALNYTNCIIPEDYANLSFDAELLTKNFPINVNNNMVEFEDVIAVYNDLTGNLQDILELYDFDVKLVSSVDIEIEDGILNANYFLRYTDLDKALWDINDDWYWGFDLGNCSQTVFGRDLADEIDKWLDINREVYTGVYYTDIIKEGDFSYIVSDHPNWEPDEDDYNIRPYGGMLCHAEYNYTETSYWYYCIGESLGNYFAEEANETLDLILEEFADPGRHITSWIILWHAFELSDTQPPYDDFNYWVGHTMRTYSGIPHKIEENPN